MILLAYLFPVFYLVLGESQDDAMMNKAVNYAIQCNKEIKVDIDTCVEMLDDGTDVNKEKYEPCKCLMACTCKKMNTMSEDGLFQNDKIQEVIDGFSAKYKDEGNRVFPKCKSITEKNCEATGKMFECVVANSEMAKKVGRDLAQLYKKKASQ